MSTDAATGSARRFPSLFAPVDAASLRMATSLRPLWKFSRSSMLMRSIGGGYDNESVAEQHSLSLAWKTLLKPCYQKLRVSIYETNVERKRFRQILLNAVMATDVSSR